MATMTRDYTDDPAALAYHLFYSGAMLSLVHLLSVPTDAGAWSRLLAVVNYTIDLCEHTPAIPPSTFAVVAQLKIKILGNARLRPLPTIAPTRQTRSSPTWTWTPLRALRKELWPTISRAPPSSIPRAYENPPFAGNGLCQRCARSYDGRETGRTEAHRLLYFFQVTTTTLFMTFWYLTSSMCRGSLKHR